MDFARLLETFLAEAHECLVELERGILVLADSGDEETLQAIFRHVHTLKGSASCVSLEALTRAAHHLEDVVGAALQTKRAADPALAGLLLNGVDVLASLTADAAAQRDDVNDARVVAIANRCETWLAATAPKAEAPAGDVASSPGPELRERTIRVDVARLDHAMDLAGGLTIARGRLADAIQHGDIRRAADALQATDTLIRDLEQQILELRLVPLRSSFERLRRAVHDLGLATGKQVGLELVCDEVEVDMAVAEALRAPLTHLIRNAIDHGIEAPAERVAAGKPPRGRITVAARHESGHLVVELGDDGAGLDHERLLARAAAMGLPTDSNGDDVWELAFVPGLSTADTVGDLSGRGIGMDVVRRSIEALRGSVRLRSIAGAGVTVTIVLPLALSIIHGLAVRVGDEVYLLPVDSVFECVELDRERAVRSARGGVLELRGDALPYLRLADHFDARACEGGRTNVVVVEHEGMRAGIEVDELLGEIQTVIKPMGKLFEAVDGVAGSAVLGNGRIALVIDVRGVLRVAVPSRIAA